MAILFDRVPTSEIGTTYTHYGRMYKIVPVYLGDPFGPSPIVAVRNGYPDWLLDAIDWVWNLAVSTKQMINEDFEHPGFMIAVDGEYRTKESHD